MSDSPCVELVLLWSQQCLDRAPLVHRAIALRYLVEGQREIENFTRIDHALQDEIDEVRQVSAHWRRAAMQSHVGVEQLLAIKADAVRYADEANSASGTRGANRLHHRFLRAHALEDGVSADTPGQVFDPGDALISALNDDVGGAELSSELLSRRVAAHDDDPFGAHLLRGEDAQETDRAVTDHRDSRAWLDVGRVRGKPPGAQHVRRGQQAWNQVVGWDIRRD
jgi:hypothetical protein